ncbi:MAG: hypothetical protein BA863_12195 [Desulfovibrio sp. S3730MH75]|nr:MAG: hypothetical protein BA863_12195 [Desulfovibrio sp. S3730MH75]
MLNISRFCLRGRTGHSFLQDFLFRVTRLKNMLFYCCYQMWFNVFVTAGDYISVKVDLFF